MFPREGKLWNWDTQNTQTIPYWEYWEYIGWKGRESQHGHGPYPSVLTYMNNLEISSLFTKLSLGITLVVRISRVTAASRHAVDPLARMSWRRIRCVCVCMCMCVCERERERELSSPSGTAAARALSSPSSPKKKKRVGCRDCKRYTLRSFSLLSRSSRSSLAHKCYL